LKKPENGTHRRRRRLKITNLKRCFQTAESDLIRPEIAVESKLETDGFERGSLAKCVKIE